MEVKMYWVYKCNSRNMPHQVAYGDWNDFFVDGRPDKWGSTEWIPALAQAKARDIILAYQTDRNELVGLAKVAALRRRGSHLDLILKPIKRIGVKVRPLKDLDTKIAAIEAFKPGPIRTLYPIDRAEVQRLLRVAGLHMRLERQAARSVVAGLATGAGFGSPESNRRVERSAVQHVTRHFRNRGWQVRDVSKEKRGYDLDCTRKVLHLKVEVKGVAGAKRRFPITAAERRLWSRDQQFVLALVMHARRKYATLELFRGPASIRRFKFVPLQFMAAT